MVEHCIMRDIDFYSFIFRFREFVLDITHLLF
jgi:hypothetical protein